VGFEPHGEIGAGRHEGLLELFECVSFPMVTKREDNGVAFLSIPLEAHASRWLAPRAKHAGLGLCRVRVAWKVLGLPFLVCLYAPCARSLALRAS
jgi:hypothetical protein